MAAQLTVLIPCKNERRNIRPCIDSVRGLADEILIADSGSIDGTLDIVREMGGCRIIEREYVTPADFKNWAIPQAEHPWVLIVDADERVTDKLAAEIRGMLAAAPETIDGYWIGRKNFFLGYHIAHCGWNRDDVLRLIRRDHARYTPRRVHEGIELAKQRVGRLSNPLLHYTTWSTGDYVVKLDRYAKLGALNLIDEAREPGLSALFLSAPLRFVQLYFLRLGFLDGVPGFQVCMLTAFYSFLKKAKLWEMRHGFEQPDPEAEQKACSTISIAARREAAARQLPQTEPREQLHAA
jgi:glycosyltransferase involved in cell wall biosynthesis